MFRRAGFQLKMTLTLPEALRTAGLPQPYMFLDGPVDLGSDWSGYDYLAECLRSAMPLFERFGIVTAKEVDVDTFARRMRDEVVDQHSYVVLPLMVGGRARRTC